MYKIVFIGQYSRYLDIGHEFCGEQKLGISKKRLFLMLEINSAVFS